MNPFSPVMYIKRNRVRAISIIIMLACTCVVFMGGMYIDNIGDICDYSLRKPSEFLFWFQNGNNNDITEEANALYAEQDSLLPESAKTYMDVDCIYAEYECIMGFNIGSTWFLQRSGEDFDTFVKLTDILPKDMRLDDNSLILSEMLANNWGVKEGEILKGNGGFEHMYFPADMKVEKVLPLDGVQLYGWSSSAYSSGVLILSTTEEHSPTLTEDLNSLQNTITDKYKHILAYTNEYQRAESKEELAILSYFFAALIVIIAVVFAITVNATFAAMYEKRKYEFSIYKAIGFSKKSLFGKILGELLVMDGIGLAAGAGICFLVIKILNAAIWSSGQQFIHISVLGVVGTLLCNVAIIIPVVMANMKRIKRYDVTVY